MTTWKIDPAHSAVEFKVKHMMISNVRGQFEAFDGTIEFEPDRPEDTRVDIRIDASSINTRVGDRDAHLRSADFLHADEYPYLTFKSTHVEVLNPAEAKLYGYLTIRGSSHPVVLDVQYAGLQSSPWGSTSAGFTAETRINRKDWGLTWNVALETGGLLVGDEIAINIELELIKVEEAVLETEASAN